MLRRRHYIATRVFCVLILTAILVGVSSAADGLPQEVWAIGVAPSQQEIIERYKERNITLGDDRVNFAQAPLLTAPYRAGQVMESELKESLDVLNFMRFVAGVPDDITIKPEYTTLTQHAAALMAANGLLAHTQTRRWNMPNSFYSPGARGTNESNLGKGYGDITDSLLNYLQDTDYVNIFKMGHRRWLLNPAMQATGFGFANGYSATYAFDRGRPGVSEFEYIAWPAANTPVELCTPRKGNYAFTVVLGPAYEPAKLEKITVNLTSGDKKWQLTPFDYSLEKFNESKRFLGVNTEAYGPANCVIFSVGAFQAGERVDIQINGLVKDGKETTLSYCVQFFSLVDKSAPVAEGSTNSLYANGALR